MDQNIPNSHELDVDSTENNVNHASFGIPMNITDHINESPPQEVDNGRNIHCAGSDITKTGPAKEKSNDTGFEDEDQKAHAPITSELRSKSANNDRIVGNKGKVNKLHCVLVVVSLIFFAVIPSLFYGHSLKRTDKEHYKAVVALAASLFCIISLSFAKAYAFNMDKLKTVAEYTAMAIGAAAVSFIASQLVSLPSDYRKG